MRPSTLSRKLDLGAAIGEKSFYEWQNGTARRFVNRKFARDGTTVGGFFMRVFLTYRSIISPITPIENRMMCAEVAAFPES
jgi:hypothetical protein